MFGLSTLRQLAVTLTLLLASVCTADTAFSDAIRLYQRGSFQDAAATFSAAVQSAVPGSGERRDARVYLAASYFAIDDLAAARAQLRLLYAEYPDAQVDTARFSPEFVQLAATVRMEHAAAMRPAELKPVEVTPIETEPVEIEQREDEASTPLALRVGAGVVGLGNLVSRAGTGGLELGADVGHFQTRAQFLYGGRFGAALEAGAIFGDALRPRFGVRSTFVPALSTASLGGAAGVDFSVASAVTLSASATVERFFVADDGRIEPWSAGIALSARFDLVRPPASSR